MQQERKEVLNKIFDFVFVYLKWILLFICVLMVLVNCRTCSRLNDEKIENTILRNNILAMNDTLSNYKDKNGNNCAEMRAMCLRIDELADSLKLERGKTPITIIKYTANVSDSFNVNTIVIHDTAYINNIISDTGYIESHEFAAFGRSSRSMDIKTPYRVNREDGLLYADSESCVTIEQNIWLESVLYKDKNEYTYIRLKTDYPGVTFNSGQTILVMDAKSERKMRKQFGLGIGIHAGCGMVYDNGFKQVPYIGIGIGLQWNPRFLQF